MILIAIPFRHKIKNSLVFFYRTFKGNTGNTKMANCENCATFFNDGIAAHENAYNKEGIPPQETDVGLNRLEEKNELVYIETNDSYIVRVLKHSKPLLLPKAVKFLDKLSRLYQKKCSENDIDYIPFEITSATRSKKSIKGLMKQNKNAISESPHLKGKTFDISYAAFTENKIQLKLFNSALLELKNNNQCYVKFERNGCLHITVN